MTSGTLLRDGDVIPLNHNVFIPGNGKTAVLCTGEYGIYIFVGGDYTIVPLAPEGEETTPEGSETTPEGSETAPEETGGAA